MRTMFGFILVALSLCGCTATDIANTQQALADSRAAAVALQAQSATQPGAKPIDHAAGEIIKAADKAAPVLDKVAAVADDVASLKQSVVDLTKANATANDRIAAIAASVSTTTKVIHDTAPGSPADQYGQLINAGLILGGLFLAHRTTNKAITTPGTTGTTPVSTTPPAGG